VGLARPGTCGKSACVRRRRHVALCRAARPRAANPHASGTARRWPRCPTTACPWRLPPLRLPRFRRGRRQVHRSSPLFSMSAPLRPPTASATLTTCARGAVQERSVSVADTCGAETRREWRDLRAHGTPNIPANSLVFYECPTASQERRNRRRRRPPAALGKSARFRHRRQGAPKRNLRMVPGARDAKRVCRRAECGRLRAANPRASGTAGT